MIKGSLVSLESNRLALKQPCSLRLALRVLSDHLLRLLERRQRLQLLFSIHPGRLDQDGHDACSAANCVFRLGT